MSEKFRAPFEELLKRNDSLVLKMHVAGHARAFAQPGFDPDAPLFEFSMNLAGISTEAIPDSVFEMPDDYQAAPMEELLQTAMPFRPALSPTAYGQAPPPSR